MQGKPTQVRGLVTAAAAVAGLTVASPAAAEPVEHRYQMAIADAVGVGLVGAGIWVENRSKTGESPIATRLYQVGGVIFVVGAPATHLANGNPKVAGLAAVTRLGGIVGGALIGITFGASGDAEHVDRSVLIGAGVGFVLAAAFDYLVYARVTDGDLEKQPAMLVLDGRF